MSNLDNIRDQLATLGLIPSTVEKHQQALRRLKSGEASRFFPVIDTCRLDNGGILDIKKSLSALQGVAGSGRPAPFAAFIPAAGAASRYIRPLAELEHAAEHGDRKGIWTATIDLRDQGAENWPLPPLLSKLIAFPDACHNLSDDELEHLKTETTTPKALMPCVAEGHSFLHLKLIEHRAIPGIGEEIFIVPTGMKETFEKELIRSSLSALPTTVSEQHGGLSTIRFQPSSEPFLDKNGHPSLVPAGHGTLTELFQVGSGKSHSLFIRNIDNITGSNKEVVSETSRFLELHDKILTLMNGIRSALAKNDVAAAEIFARPLLDLASPMFFKDNGSQSILVSIQRALFHSNVSDDPSLAELQKLYARPLNILGQVPNTGKDIGGTPCFVKYKNAVLKLCLEVPHASAQDKKQFLANPEKATHFNPVFAAAEIVADPDYYQKRNEDFWLMAEKTFQGSAVIYYETVLYELIGNSSLANTLFVEIPRILFNPHKSMSDAATNSIRRWLPKA